MILYQAPTRTENDSGPREFAYLAEVDILGWKFRAMKDGSFVIDTPKVVEGMEGRNMIAILGRGHKRLIEALLALDPDVPPGVLSDHYHDVGRIVGAPA